jgi:hypothetical protein
VITGPLDYCVKFYSDSLDKYSEVENMRMLEFLIDNIFLVVGEQVFQQSIGIPMVTDYLPFVAELFYFIRGRIYAKFLHKEKVYLAMTIT